MKARPNRKPWGADEEKLLRESYPNVSEKDLMGKFPGRTPSSIYAKALNMGLRRGISGSGLFWSKDEDERLRKLLETNVSREEIKKAFPNRTRKAIELHAAGKGIKKSAPNSKEADPKESAATPAPILEKRDWPTTKVYGIDEKKWKESPPRVGFISGVDFKDSGFRAGLIEVGFEIFADEACRYIALVGRLVSKKWFQDRLKQTSGKYRNEYLQYLIQEAAKELAYTIPKIKRPGASNEYVRIYIVTSPPYDGEIGEEVARKLQELRPEDVRVYNPVSDRVDVKEVGKAIGLICPEISRLPSEYFSAAVDREVKDKESQTSVDYPDLWVVGTTSSSVHIPDRGRKPPIISLPSLKRLQSIRVGENQQGVRIVEFSRVNSEEYFVRTYSLKDLTRNERQFITGIKEGAHEIHKRIVELIKNEGARTEGLIADKLGMEGQREEVRKALEFLVESKMSLRKNWPGLCYDKHSQRYDFHTDWIQERLRYPSLVKGSFIEDRFLFFSCLHAGYNTTDYEYVVKRLPEILFHNKVRYVCCLGDVIAGLSHNFLEQGEVMGGMNYTEQEQLAAELVGTILAKVFERGLQESPDVNKLSAKEIIGNLLPTFLYIAGNHDDWQRRFGVLPLVTFRSKLMNLLAQRIEIALKNHNLAASSVAELMGTIHLKLIELSMDGANYMPTFTLPSRLTIELRHPHMGRAKTKSLRAQEILESSSAHIVGHGNFHTAIGTDLWEPQLGQRVDVEAATFVIFTDFENKKNKKTGFGPGYLRVLSRDGRIFMTESMFDHRPMLKAPRPKWTNWQELKKELGVYLAP